MHFAFQSIQNKTILTTTGLHDVLPKFFTSAPTCHPNTFSLSLIGDRVMVITFQVLSLVTRTHGSLSFPTCSLSFQELITLHAFATSRSLTLPTKPCSILLKFIFQYIATLYLFYHCTSMFISYALYTKNLTNLEIIMFID